LFLGVNARDHSGDERVAVEALRTWRVMDSELSKHMPGFLKNYTALSNRIHNVLREPFRSLLPDQTDYDRAFDFFEYLQSLKVLQIAGVLSPGRFAWRRNNRGENITQEIWRRIGVLTKDWPPYSTGIFKYDFSEVLKLRNQHDEKIANLHWGW
jgi:hypothetical protein